jgi:hypothetical protein
MELDKLNKELIKKAESKKEDRLDEGLLTVALASLGFVFLLRAIFDIIKNRKTLSPKILVQRWNEIADLKARNKELKQQSADLDVRIEQEKQKQAEIIKSMKREEAMLAKIAPKMDDPEVQNAGRDYMTYAYRLLDNTKNAESLLAKSQALGRLRTVLQDKMTPEELDTLSDLLDYFARRNKALMN